MKRFSIIAGILGFTAVALGAFGAHLLKPLFTSSQMQTYETAVKYHFIHTLAILFTAWLAETTSNRWHRYAVRFFVAGVLIFSGSLYLLSLRQVLGITSWSFLGAVTPIGGISFMLGWCCITISGFKH